MGPTTGAEDYSLVVESGESALYFYRGAVLTFILAQRYGVHVLLRPV